MPVGIGNVCIACNHAAVADIDCGSRANSNAGTNQAVVAELDTSLVFSVRPDGKPYFVVPCGDHSCIVAKHDWCTKDFHMPGFHKEKAFPKGFELGAQEVFYIEFLKIQICFFD